MSDPALTLTLDDTDYAPGETVTITATAANLVVGSSIIFNVDHVLADPDGTPGTSDDILAQDLSGTGTAWTITDGGEGDLDGLANGIIVTSWEVGQDAVDQTFLLSATDVATHDVATAAFTDAPRPNDVGVLAAPTGPSPTGSDNVDGSSTYNDTHWAVLDGATINGTILNATDAVTASGADAADGNTVWVEIKSSEHGNTFVPGTYHADDSITFTWTVEAPDSSDICATTIVAYETGGGFNSTTLTGGTFTNTSNDVAKDGQLDGDSGSAAGFGVVNDDGSHHDVCDDDTANPSVTIAKNIVCDDDGTVFLADTAINLLKDDGKVQYQIVVTNTGDVALENPTVTDPTLGALGAHTDTETGPGTPDDNILDVGETWTYTVLADWSAGGPHTNTATVAVDYLTSSISESDSAAYFGLDPKLSIAKVTGDGHYTGDSLVTFAGTAITWTYTVTNTSNDAGITFDSVEVTDTNSAGDSVTPVLDAALSTGEEDGKLDIGDSWVYVASGTAHSGSYTNTGTVTGTTGADDCGATAEATASDGSGYTGLGEATTYTQGFWGSHTSAWDGIAGNEGKNPVVGEVNGTNTTTLVLGGGLGGPTFTVNLDVARLIESSSTTGDARIIMLQQLIAAQLDYQLTGHEPNGLIEDGVAWLIANGGMGTDLKAGEWSSSKTNGLTITEGSKVLTSSAAWGGNVDPDSAAHTPVTGEGLKNALMWWNDGHLVIDTNGTVVAWDQNGTAAGGVVGATIEPNNLDLFWTTLHLVDTDPAAGIQHLTGIG